MPLKVATYEVHDGVLQSPGSTGAVRRRRTRGSLPLLGAQDAPRARPQGQAAGVPDRSGPAQDVAVSPLRARTLDADRGTLRAAARVLFKEDLLSRPRYQEGSLQLMPRSVGPAVWVYRWRETDETGERRLRKKIIGTIQQYATKARALAAVQPLR